MALFDFTVAIYAFDQWTGASTNATVNYPIGTTFTLNPGATLDVIDVQDDDGNSAGSSDNLFSDGYIDTPGDGSTPSTANNDQLLSQPITLNGVTYSVGDQVELEFAFETTTGETFWVIRIDGTNVGISGPVLPTPGTTYEVGSSADGQATPFQDVPCFTDGAMVHTPAGPIAIEKLKAGDLVLTLDHGPQPILWAGCRRPSALEFLFFPQIRPITVTKGALGPNTPNRDLVVSPKHRMMISSDMASYYFGEAEVLLTAESLIDGKTIFRTSDRAMVTYRHLLFAEHEVIFVNGAPTESLFPGTSTLSPEALMEIDLMGIERDTTCQFARPALRGREAKILQAAA